MSQSISLPMSPPPPYAGFPLRFFAAIIDLLILGVALSVFVSFLSVAMKISTAFLDLRPGQPPSEILKAFGNTFIYLTLAFFILISWLYFAVLECSRWRATLGKRALGLYVTDPHGNQATFARTTLRFASGRLLLHVPIIGFYYFLVDCLSILFTQRKQAIHDVLAGCLVLRESATRSLASRGRQPAP